MSERSKRQQVFSPQGRGESSRILDGSETNRQKAKPLVLGKMTPRYRRGQEGELFEEQLNAIKSVTVYGIALPPVGKECKEELPQQLAMNLEEDGITSLLPIQRYTIPTLLAGYQDVFVEAPTGSGKSYAFLIPIVLKLLDHRKENPRRTNRPFALIIANTGLLCTQTLGDAKKLCKRTNLSVAGAIGGASMGEMGQDLDRGVDILIATAGRLKDVLEKKKLILEDLHYMIYDEADKMTTVGPFRTEVLFMKEHLPEANKHTLCSAFFTATMPPNSSAFDGLCRDNCVFFIQDPNAGIEHGCIPLSVMEPCRHRQLLLALLDQDLAIQGRKRGDGNTAPYVNRTVVFFETKQLCNFFANYLTLYGYAVALINSDRPLSARKEMVDAVGNGTKFVIVATDSFARGHDVDGITHVINYDVPATLESYKHRSGRTGRKGNRGRCTTFVDVQNMPDWRIIGELGAYIIGIGQKIIKSMWFLTERQLNKQKNELGEAAKKQDEQFKDQDLDIPIEELEQTSFHTEGVVLAPPERDSDDDE